LWAFHSKTRPKETERENSSVKRGEKANQTKKKYQKDRERVLWDRQLKQSEKVENSKKPRCVADSAVHLLKL